MPLTLYSKGNVITLGPLCYMMFDEENIRKKAPEGIKVRVMM